MAMSTLPSGTLTFLLTDIEGSTRLWEQDPPAMRVAIARHDALLGAAVAQHHGILVKSLMLSREAGDRPGIGYALQTLGEVARRRGAYAPAAACLRESLVAFSEVGEQRGLAWSLEGLAKVAGLEGQPMRAARLFGVAEAVREVIRVPVDAWDRPDHDRLVAAVRAELGEEAFEAARLAGRALPVDQAIAEALDQTAPEARLSAPARPQDGTAGGDES